MSNRGPYYNQSGVPDPTAHEALKPIIQDEHELEQKVHVAVTVIKIILGLAGFDLLNRVELRDKKSGKVFK